MGGVSWAGSLVTGVSVGAGGSAGGVLISTAGSVVVATLSCEGGVVLLVSGWDGGLGFHTLCVCEFGEIEQPPWVLTGLPFVTVRQYGSFVEVSKRVMPAGWADVPTVRFCVVMWSANN